MKNELQDLIEKMDSMNKVSIFYFSDNIIIDYGLSYNKAPLRVPRSPPKKQSKSPPKKYGV